MICLKVKLQANAVDYSMLFKFIKAHKTAQLALVLTGIGDSLMNTPIKTRAEEMLQLTCNAPLDKISSL